MGGEAFPNPGLSYYANDNLHPGAPVYVSSGKIKEFGAGISYLSSHDTSATNMSYQYVGVVARDVLEDEDNKGYFVANDLVRIIPRGSSCTVLVPGNTADIQAGDQLAHYETTTIGSDVDIGYMRKLTAAIIATETVASFQDMAGGFGGIAMAQAMEDLSASNYYGSVTAFASTVTQFDLDGAASKSLLDPQAGDWIIIGSVNTGNGKKPARIKEIRGLTLYLDAVAGTAMDASTPVLKLVPLRALLL